LYKLINVFYFRYSLPAAGGSITHIEGNQLFVSVEGKILRVDSNSMVTLATVNDIFSSNISSSFLPFGSDHVVRSNPSPPTQNDEALTFFQLSSNLLDDLPNYQGISPKEVLVYTKDGTQYPILIGLNLENNNSTKVISPNYQLDLDMLPGRVLFDGDHLIVITTFPPLYSTIHLIDIVSVIKNRQVILAMISFNA
jgi:hypothetical protein